MEPAALSQRQLDALYRLLVPRGVDPEDERTLLKLAVTMSSQLDQNRRTTATTVQTSDCSNSSADMARNMVSKSLAACLLGSEPDSNPKKMVVPRLEVLMAFHSDSELNDGFFTYCLNVLKQTNVTEKHIQEIAADELSVISSALVAAGNVSALALSPEIQSAWSWLMLDVLRANIPSSTTAVLRAAHLVEDVDCPDERFSSEFFNFLHLVFHVTNHMKLAESSWVSLLCASMSICPDGSPAKSKVTSIMSFACGSSQDHASIYLFNLFDLLLEFVRPLVSSEMFDISFNSQVQLQSSMSSLIRLAANDFTIWLEYIASKPEVSSFLLEGAITDLPDISGLFLRLLALCGSHQFSELGESTVEQLLDKLLYAPSKSMREDASFVARNMDIVALISFLNRNLLRMPSAGMRAEQFALLWANIIKDRIASDHDQSTFDAISQFVQLSRNADKALSHHPNAYIYRNIGRYLNLEEPDPSAAKNTTAVASSNSGDRFGFYLESEPCPVCCDTFGDFEMFKVRDVESESKFTHHTRMIRLQEMKSIRSIHIRLEELSTARSVKTIRLYFNAEKLDTLASLKDKWDRWTLAKTMRVSPWSNDIVLAAGTDFCAFNILLEFVDFHESMDGCLEIIQCPRCRTPVTSRHGICSQCKENAFQCRQCRNINYEHLDGFLCNECGFCRFAQLQISISARPSFTVATIHNESQRRHLLDRILGTHAVELQASLDDTASNRTDILSLLSTEPVSQGRLSRVYREARSTFRNICSNYAIVIAARRELLRYIKRCDQKAQPMPASNLELPELSNLCFVCLKHFVTLSGQMLQILSSSRWAQPILISCNLLPYLIQKATWSESCVEKEWSRSTLASLCECSPDYEREIFNFMESRLCLLINNISEIQPNQAFENFVCDVRVQAVLKLFHIAVASGHDAALVSQHMLVPCLSYFIKLVSRTEVQTSVIVSAPKLTRRHQFISESPSLSRCHINSMCRKSRTGAIPSDEQKSVATIKAYVDMLLASSFSSEHANIQDFLIRHRPAWLRTSNFFPFTDSGYLRKLILNPASLDVRVKAAELIRILCERSELARDALIPALIKIIVSSRLGSSSIQLFELFETLAHRANCKLSMASPHFIEVFIALMRRKVFLMKKGHMEASYPLFGAVSLLHHFSDSIGFVRESLKSNVFSFVDAFLCLQGFYLFRTKQTQDAAAMLLHIIDEVFSQSDADRMALIRAYFEALSRSHLDMRMSIRILEQIYAVVNPRHHNDHCQLLLRKASSQEEFIRGNMKKTPYSSSDLSTMEDLKNKICRDLDLEDAAGMFELLVNGCIIDLSLPIAGVYQKLWKPALLAGTTSAMDYDSDYDDLVVDTSSMVVTYRLKGLDGEATEDIVTHLNDDSDQVEPEVKYATLSVAGECGGIAQLLSLLQNLKAPFGENDLESHFAALAIRTLRCCAYIERNRSFLTPGYHFLLSYVLTIFRSRHNEHGGEISNNLLDILATIVDENDVDAIEDIRKIIDFLLTYTPLPVAWPRLASLLPGITRGVSSAAKVLLESFIPHLDWPSIDCKQKSAFPAECFAFVAESLTTSSHEVAYELRSLASESVVPAAYEYLKSIDPQSSVVSNQSLPFALRILTGLVKGFELSQVNALPIIPLFHRLERITSENKVGPSAENLLEALCYNCPSVKAVVKKLRDDTRNSRKMVAIAKRKKLLSQLGLQSSGKSSVSILGMESVVPDPGLTCMVCQEGYAYKPRDMLGFYVFDKEINLNAGSSLKDENICLTSVTHFNTIHYTCHAEAAGVDRRKKPPKSEWEGATLRNAHTLCNNIFPILHKSNSLDEYALRVDDYWRNIPFRSAFQMQKIEILLHNIRLLVAKFAEDKSFSEFSKGGGRQSNIRFVPYLIQLGVFMMSNSPGEVTSRLRKTVMQIIKESEEQWISIAFSDGTTTYSSNYAMEYYLIASLLVLKPEEWLRERDKFLRRLIIFSRKFRLEKAFQNPPTKVRRTTSSSTSSSSFKQAAEFEEDYVLESMRPVLIFYIMVDYIHGCLVKFEPDASGNDSGNMWDRLLRYIRHRHQDILLSLDEFCQILSTKILMESNLDSLLNMCSPNMCSSQSGQRIVLSLWSLAVA